MAYKNKSDQQQAWRNHYQRNKARYAERNKRRKQEMRDWLATLKGELCIGCGNTYPSMILDWHHIDPSTKSFAIADSVGLGYGKDRILKEIAKCELRCKNCHYATHHCGIV